MRVEMCADKENGYYRKWSTLKHIIHTIDFILWYVTDVEDYQELGDNMFVIEWFAGINCIILWSQI